MKKTVEIVNNNEELHNRPMKNKVEMNVNIAKDAYIPDVGEWGKMYEKWHGKLAKALGAYGSPSDCEEAVAEAFIKAMGYHERLHLEKALTPKTDAGWFGFLKYQALGRLSCYHQVQRRFTELKDWSVKEETVDEDDWGDVEEDSEYAVRTSVEDGDRLWVRNEFRKTLDDLCRETGVKSVNHLAYVLFALDGKSGEEVEREVGGIKANNIYQIRSRLEKLIKGNRGRFEYIYRELKAA